MKIISWNINGIRAIEKKGFLDWLDTYQPDILCLQETKARPEQLNDQLIHPYGYKTFWKYPKKKGYAGVSVFTKGAPSDISDDFSPKDLETEGRALILKYSDFILANVYFPNGRMSQERLQYKIDFYSEFLDYLDSLQGQNVIFCGDVNTAHKPVDLSRPKQNEIYSGFLPEEREWLDKFIRHGYIDSFRAFCKEPGQYTWWDFKSKARERNVGWRIDYFFVSEKFMPKVKDSFILSEVMGSDHCPIGIELEQN